jgi:membrane-bound ClpP family serine protease
MIVFGIGLLIIAVLIPKLAVLWGIGVIVLVVGVILAVLGTMGRAVRGRRHYYQRALSVMAV